MAGREPTLEFVAGCPVCETVEGIQLETNHGTGAAMQKRRIGQGDREVSAIGYGATGQSSGCGPATGWQQAIALVRAAVDVLGRRCRVDGA